MNHLVTGVISFFAGTVAGIVVTALCAAAKEGDRDNPCYGCFGASFGDCDRCPKNEKDGEQNEQ